MIKDRCRSVILSLHRVVTFFTQGRREERGGTSQFLTEMGERAQGRVLEGKEKVVIIIMT